VEVWKKKPIHYFAGASKASQNKIKRDASTILYNNSGGGRRTKKIQFITQMGLLMLWGSVSVEGLKSWLGQYWKGSLKC
jgi:hypothetical protein